ncbi:MK15 kinase, partial [Psilopogon haemacephalus]|nr:MK15 kinase [Psilopogon haemacephalus]
AYGIVWKATDRKTGETVAVKKIFDAFRNKTDAQSALSPLQQFGEHPNIIKLLDVIRAENDKDIYLIFEFMGETCHCTSLPQQLPLLPAFAACMLLISTKIPLSRHRSRTTFCCSIQPSNILLDAECFVKLCDFGLARSLSQVQEEQSNPALTEYVATRWYRAPEILLSSQSYTKGVDMWSIGCILGELLLGKPLFPGTSTVNQIEQIFRVIPVPSPEDLVAVQSDYKALILSRASSRQRVTFEELLPSSTPLPALDLLKKLLVFNPEKRLTAEQALQHPYVRRFHCPAREPSLASDVVQPLGDAVQLSVAEYRHKLYEMILERKLNGHPKEQMQRENAQLSQPESRPLLPDPTSVTLPATRGQSQATPPLLKDSSVHPGAATSVQPQVPSQGEGLARPLCQRGQPSVMYNPITHTVIPCRYSPPAMDLGGVLGSHHFPASSHAGNANSGAVVRTCSAPPFHQQARTASNSKLGRDITWANTQLPPTRLQKLQNVSRSLLITLAFFLTQNPTRTQFPSREVCPLPKPGKKMFQVTANVGAAGDAKAWLGSYSQAYGTISKSALQSLPM